MDHVDAAKTGGKSAAGIWYGASAFTAWGLLPFYWKMLDLIPAHEILAHRIFWSFICMCCVQLVTGGWKAVRAVLVDRKKLLPVFACGFIISLNWFTYIYAVNSNHVIEACMGYYINPLVVILLGVTVLKEKLTRWQCAAIVLASVGVMIITVQYGRIPWLALGMAISFAAYGLIKKMIDVDATTGLTLETFAVMPFALAFIVALELGGGGALSTVAPVTIAVLAGTGVITLTPLLLFARGIRLNKFSVMGFLQYITPTISLFLGVFVFRERFAATDLVSFCFIWAALAVFTLDSTGVLTQRKDGPAPPLPSGPASHG